MVITEIWQRRQSFILVINQQRMDMEHLINEEIHSTVVI